MDVILQGPCYDWTVSKEGVVRQFLNADFIDNVIVSHWDYEVFEMEHPKLIEVRNADIDNPGIGNRNRQILTTRAGLEHVKSDTCAKFRTDQHFPLETLQEMDDFYKRHEDGQIFTLGLYKNWPFHPRDHMFWGPTDKMKLLFDCPFDTYSGHTDYNQCLRAEAWLGCHYAANYNSRMKYFVKYPATFLTDNAPNRYEAFQVHDELYHKLFWPFPRIQYSWPKIGLSSYYYHYTSSDFSEYWHEEIISSV